ncbi:MAG: glycosyltransferase family 2 protein [Clostridia bacterium]|nr:glycosyltransferase family 2 protein [Clostridia bacterium]
MVSRKEGGGRMITVLLAVYNGEKYLREQIDSMLAQTVNNIKIVIRDDGSTDKSPAIIAEYAEKFSDKISVISGAPTGGAAANFAELLKSCDDDYIMLADQDDVWFSDKIQKTFDVMLKTENGDKTVPVLVHSDLTVTDARLNTIDKSFFNYQKIYPDDLSLSKLLVQNYVTGCTVMINRALKNKALPVPEGAIMHDWWLALVAAVFGKIETVKQPLMFYRQHGNNQVGAKAGAGVSFFMRMIKTFKSVKENCKATYRQAQLLLKSYGDIMSADKAELLGAYIAMQNLCRFKKIKAINKYGFKKCTALRVLGQYFIA